MRLHLHDVIDAADASANFKHALRALGNRQVIAAAHSDPSAPSQAVRDVETEEPGAAVNRVGQPPRISQSVSEQPAANPRLRSAHGQDAKEQTPRIGNTRTVAQTTDSTTRDALARDASAAGEAQASEIANNANETPSPVARAAPNEAAARLSSRLLEDIARDGGGFARVLKARSELLADVRAGKLDAETALAAFEQTLDGAGLDKQARDEALDRFALNPEGEAFTPPRGDEWHPDAASRKECMLMGACRFHVAENPDPFAELPLLDRFVRRRRNPPHRFHWLGREAARQYGKEIAAAANEFGVDPRLIRAIMYLETSQGWYDIAERPNEKSILPMNVNEDYWGSFVGSREQLRDPECNIRAGARMISEIQAKLPKNATIEQIATLYQNLGRARVSYYGVWIADIYREQSWLKLEPPHQPQQPYVPPERRLPDDVRLWR